MSSGVASRVASLRDPDVARRVGLVLAAASAAAVVTGVALFIASGAQLTPSFADVFGDATGRSWLPHNTIGGLALAIAFAVMVRHQPTNAAVWTLGWAMVAQTFGLALVIGLNELGLARFLSAGGHVGATAVTFDELPTWLYWSIAVRDVAWVFGTFPLVTLALLLFPDGRLPSRRWRPVVVASLVGMGVLFVTLVAFARPGGPKDGVTVGNYPDAPIIDLVAGLGLAVLIGATVASIASLLVRYRHASGDTRRQIRWIALGGGPLGLAMSLWLVALVDEPLATQLVWAAYLAAFPVHVGAYAVAILRYRLYDIDVVISRSLVVAALAGFIATVYVAVVVGVGAVLGVADDASLGLQVAATAIVAVAFQPLRRRVRSWADRLVYGQRATPYEVLAQFSRQAANAGDEANLQRIAEVLAAGTGASPATIWLRVGDHLRPAAWSDTASAPLPTAVALHGDDLPELPAPLVVPVRHDGELLGAVSLTKPRSEPPTREDEELTTRLAGGLALVLRNARLTAELRDHLAALEASRSRLVQAQDEARRKIESELRHGAQRQLAELRARLELVRKRSAGAGAAGTAALLEQLEHEADEADDTLRALAQGIYPPVLEEEGVGAAVTAQASKSVLPVTAHVAGLPRYAPEVEAAVYFCVLEALQNATKYAQASSVHVALEQRGGELWFEVSDDGVGFDPVDVGHGSGLRGIAARLDTLGGALEVRSTPGVGTRVIGRLPATSRGGSSGPRVAAAAEAPA